MKFSGRRLTGYSHILKTTMPSLKATEREWVPERPAAGDLPNVETNAFGVHPPTISHLWHRFETTGMNRDARGGHTRFLGRNLQRRCTRTF